MLLLLTVWHRTKRKALVLDDCSPLYSVFLPLSLTTDWPVHYTETPGEEDKGKPHRTFNLKKVKWVHTFPLFSPWHRSSLNSLFLFDHVLLLFISLSLDLFPSLPYLSVYLYLTQIVFLSARPYLPTSISLSPSSSVWILLKTVLFNSTYYEALSISTATPCFSAVSLSLSPFVCVSLYIFLSLCHSLFLRLRLSLFLSPAESPQDHHTPCNHYWIMYDIDMAITGRWGR